MVCSFQVWSEWKGNRSNSTQASPAELKKWKMTSFLVRAHVTPSDDPRKASVDLLAIPVTLDKVKTLPSQDILTGVGYPSILVKSGSQNPSKIVPSLEEEMKPMGLPAWPVLLMEEADTVFPSGESVVAAIRKSWHEATMAPCVMEKDWYRHAKGKSISALLVPSDPQWPLLPRPKSADVNVEGEQGKI